MSVPYDFAVVEAVYNTGAYDLTTHEGHAAFVDAAITALHAHDPKWGHLLKKPGQTQIHGHAEDAALYYANGQPGTLTAVDFIIGAGGPHAKPGWNPDPVASYSASDWMDPQDHPDVDGPDEPEQPEPPFSQPYPDEQTWWPQVFDVEVGALYTKAGKVYPDGPSAFRWASRTAYDIAAGMTKEASLEKHLEECARELGVSVD